MDSNLQSTTLESAPSFKLFATLSNVPYKMKPVKDIVLNPMHALSQHFNYGTTWADIVYKEIERKVSNSISRVWVNIRAKVGEPR